VSNIQLFNKEATTDILKDGFVKIKQRHDFQTIPLKSDRKELAVFAVDAHKLLFDCIKVSCCFSKKKDFSEMLID
jgi:hypothetical protein